LIFKICVQGKSINWCSGYQKKNYQITL